MRHLLALLFAVFALSLGACGTPSENHRPTKKIPANRRQLFRCPNKTRAVQSLIGGFVRCELFIGVHPVQTKEAEVVKLQYSREDRMRLYLAYITQISHGRQASRLIMAEFPKSRDLNQMAETLGRYGRAQARGARGKIDVAVA